jgi:hypothetical protein
VHDYAAAGQFMCKPRVWQPYLRAIVKLDHQLISALGAPALYLRREALLLLKDFARHLQLGALEDTSSEASY